MIIWGTNGETLDMGIVREDKCKTCERKRPFHLYVTYKWWHLYWIFGIVTKCKYMLLCEVCSNGWEIDKKDIKEIHKEVPIPFRRRYGLLLLIAFIVVSIIVSVSQQ